MEAGLGSIRQRAYQRLLQGNGPGTLPAWVAPHCLAVEGLAAAMCACARAQGLPVDEAVVHAGCLLHDVGRSITQDVRHASLGAQLLRGDRENPWSEAVVLAVERHTGAGIDAADAATLGLPIRDYTPRTLEEQIVAHADNLYSGTKRLSLSDVAAKYEAKGLPQAWRKIERLHRALELRLGTDLERLEAATLAQPR